MIAKSSHPPKKEVGNDKHGYAPPNLLNKPRIGWLRPATCHIVLQNFSEYFIHSCLLASWRLHNSVAEVIHKSSLTNSYFINLDQAWGCGVPFWPGKVWQTKEQNLQNNIYVMMVRGITHHWVKGTPLKTMLNVLAKLFIIQGTLYQFIDKGFGFLVATILFLQLQQCNLNEIKIYSWYSISLTSRIYCVKFKFNNLSQDICHNDMSRYCGITVGSVLICVALKLFLDVNRS